MEQFQRGQPKESLKGMKTRELGSQGLVVSEIGLGCASMSDGLYGPADDAENRRVLRRAFELGITLFDTADLYGFGHNERLLGEVLGDVRDQVIFATKFGVTFSPEGVPSICGRPEYVRKSCEASLQRLGVEMIDLFYLHRLDKQVPIEETVGAMASLVREGKVRTIGLSEVSPQTIRRAHAVHPITAVQVEYSLWCRDPEADVIPVCRELEIGIVAYCPLGRGFLTGQIRSPENLDRSDYRHSDPRFKENNLKRNLELLSRVEGIAKKKRCKPGQLVLAWLLAQGGDIVPIPGTKKIGHLEENVAAIELSLSKDELSELDLIAPRGAAVGDRYDEMAMHFIDK